MKFKIENIDNITDSREVMESQPNKFTSIFIYLILLIITIFLIWAWFSQKEIVVKISGIVEPNKQSHAISNMIPGKVKTVNIKNGEIVKKGDILYTIDNSQLNLQKSNLENQKTYLTTDIKNLKLLDKSIENNFNYFGNISNQKEYYYKYKSYLAGNKISVSNKNSLIQSKDDLNDKINNLNLLKKSVSDNKNYTKKGSIYDEQFISYQASQKSIQDKLNQLIKNKQLIINSSNNAQEIQKINSDIQTNNSLLTKSKENLKIQIDSSISDSQNKVKAIENNIKSIDENKSLSNEKNKTTILSEIDTKLSLDNEKLKELGNQLKGINKNINNCIVKCSVNGKLDIVSGIEPGLMIQQGSVIANILPSKDDFKVKLTIPDKDVATIKNGQNIKYSFSALPYREYGFLKGKLKDISVDSKVDKNSNLVFFTGNGSIEKNVLYSHKGEKAEIKAGMTCEARIITRKERMLYYLLEQIGLKE